MPSWSTTASRSVVRFRTLPDAVSSMRSLTRRTEALACPAWDITRPRTCGVSRRRAFPAAR
ncbi:hypothetical protein BZL30_6619 [Mycobacterium kansasii]|uniref:Uncharacterized protein n=1 Tax=Mycobacterium kansasii TaxID=1768 RepID=A0A1V3WU69_MYCKA|nr:hypothetical protein BZL30_6619 [Mycobacterium kansasii]